MTNDTTSPFEELPTLQRASVFRRGCAGIMDIALAYGVSAFGAFTIFYIAYGYVVGRVIRTLFQAPIEDNLLVDFIIQYAKLWSRSEWVNSLFHLFLIDYSSIFSINTDDVLAHLFLFHLPFLFLFIGYYSFFLSSPLQATPGKLIFRLKVSDEAGHRLTFKKAFKRSFYQMLTVASLGIGFISLFRNEKQQTWYDKKCKTRVTSK